MKKHFLLFLLTLMPFLGAWAAVGGNITIMPANVQYTYGEGNYPTQQQTAAVEMIAPVSNPNDVALATIAQALIFVPNQPIGGPGTYTYSLMTKDGYNNDESENYVPDLAGYNITISGGNGQMTIVGKYLSADMIAAIPAVTFNGTEQRPTPEVSFLTVPNDQSTKVTLDPDEDFTFSYANNTHAGTATVTITAKENSNYTGFASKQFTINKLALTSVAVAEVENQTYNLGNPITPALTVTGTDASGATYTLRNNDLDYKVNYTQQVGGQNVATNENVGNAVGTLSAPNNGGGDFTFPAAANVGNATFTIVAKSLSADEISIVAIPSQHYTGSAITYANAKINWDVVNGDQTTHNNITRFVEFEYANNTNVGTATIIAKPKADANPQNYTGQAISTFSIIPAALNAQDIFVTFRKANPDYEEGGLQPEFINYDPINPNLFEYEGREIKPGTTAADGELVVTKGQANPITLQKGVDYEIVSYGGTGYDNINATHEVDNEMIYAAVTIKGKGNYEAVDDEGEVITKTQTFVINKKVLKLTATNVETSFGVSPTLTHTDNIVTTDDLGGIVTYTVYDGDNAVEPDNGTTDQYTGLTVSTDKYTYKATWAANPDNHGNEVPNQETGLYQDGTSPADYDTEAQVAARANYDVVNQEKTAGNIVVLNRKLIIVPNNITRKYGSKNDNINFAYKVYTGSVAEANLVDLTNFQFDVDPTIGIPAAPQGQNDLDVIVNADGSYGSYAISVKNPPLAQGAEVPQGYQAVAKAGYEIECQEGEFTVIPFPITLTANNQTILYGSEPNTEVKHNSFVKTVNDESVEVEGTSLTVTFTPAMTGDQDLISRDDLGLSLTWDGNGEVGEHAGALTPQITNPNFEAIINTEAGKVTVVTDLALKLDDADADVLDKIEAYNGKEVKVSVKFGSRSGQSLGGERKWVAGQWNTLVLPFDISVAKLSEALGYAIVNVIDNVDLTGDKPVFKFKLTMKGGNGSTTVLKANRPFTLKTSEDLDITKAYNFGTQTIVAPTADDAVKVGSSNIYFKGTYETKPVTKADNGWIWFLMGNYADGWAYIKSTSTASWNIVPFAGYIDMSAQGLDPMAAARSIFVMEEIDGTKTAIKAIDMDSNNVISNGEGWYNLNGMKMQGAPSQKGVYIQNGKKVVVK